GIFLGVDVANAVNADLTEGRSQFYGGYWGVYVRQNRWLRWRGDVSGSASSADAAIIYALAGPEFTARTGRAVFFAHSVFGYGEVDGSILGPTRNGFAMAFGGGVDVQINSRFSVRLIDADFVPSHFSGPQATGFFGSPTPNITTWDKNARVSVGVIVKFGQKK